MSALLQLVFASANVGKLQEAAAIFSGSRIALRAQTDLAVVSVAETGSTFAENALLKAQHASNATGLAAIADDSGLVVDALGGRPGVHSARYAGENATDSENRQKLLAELEQVPDANRAAAFHCVVCLVAPNLTEPLVAHGQWCGRILRAERGADGFGYDALFYDALAGESAAEMTAADKNARSHRGMALRQLLGNMAGCATFAPYVRE